MINFRKNTCCGYKPYDVSQNNSTWVSELNFKKKKMELFIHSSFLGKKKFESTLIRYDLPECCWGFGQADIQVFTPFDLVVRSTSLKERFRKRGNK